MRYVKINSSYITHHDSRFTIHALRFTKDMFLKSDTTSSGWLAFELNVLRRLKFGSVILPFTVKPDVGANLKRWNVQVAANDSAQTNWIKAVAAIENNAEKLSDEDVNFVLDDAYVPRYRLQNETLKNWFGETDAWWFDNIRQNAEKLSNPIKRAIALSVGMSVGDYVLSFDDETREFRQPLSNVFRNVRSIQPEPFDNKQNNACQNKTATDFVAENRMDLMFLQLPPAHRQSMRNCLGKSAWREEWLRGGNGFWNDFETMQAGKLGASVETKHQYLQLVGYFLQTASHIPNWVISHAEDNFVTTQDLLETIGRLRRINTVFTKDFSELSGAKAVIISA